MFYEQHILAGFVAEKTVRSVYKHIVYRSFYVRCARQQ